MKKHCFLFVGLLTFLATSCVDESGMTSSSAADEVVITTSITPIAQPKVNLRSAVAEDGTGSFTEGDAITLYVTPEAGTPTFQQDLTLQGVKWLPTLSWREIQAERATFTAFYPAVSTVNSNEILHTVPVDQTSEISFHDADLLAAKTVANQGEPVHLAFQHLMNRVVVILASEGAYTDAELQKASIQVRAKNQMAVNPATAALVEVRGGESLIQAHRVSGSTFHAIVPPQTLLDSWKSTAWIDITLGEKTVSFAAPAQLGDIPFTDLQAGKQVVITLNLDKEESGGQEMDWRSKVVWVYGLENMPPLSQWGYYDKPLGILGLEWQRQYGWYDCNKEAFLDPPVANPRDANMCWAATSSNLIHWWLDRHQQYLDRYGYKGPREYKDDIHAEVFDFYRDRFANKGQFIDDGIEYFFTGKVPPGESQPKPGVNHPGFFKDVFPNGRVTRTVYGSQNVSETIKQGLMNKEAIGLDIAVKAGKAAHAITIWGAGFDENGKLNTLYVCENNDTFFATQSSKPMQPGKQCNAGIFPRGVNYDEWGNAWVESGSPGKYTIGVRALIFLGMKDKEFEAYFAKPENQGK